MDSDILFFNYIQDDVRHPRPVNGAPTRSSLMLRRLFQDTCTIIRNIPYTYVYYCGPPDFRSKSAPSKESRDKPSKAAE